MSGPADEFAWAVREIEGAAARSELSRVSRVHVVDEALSTQDVARDLARGSPGLLVIAARQTGGRGRLGRSWADTGQAGLAATFVVSARTQTGGHVSLASGVAACMTCEEGIGPGGALLGIRWPNDVVERDGARRKAAGVLVERSGDVYLVGIGINITQSAGDWERDLAGSAVSLRQLGSAWRRAEAAVSLARALDRCLALDGEALREAWRARDVIGDRRCQFEHDGRRFVGRVLSIDPLNRIEIFDDERGRITLPAETTSLVSVS